MAMVEYSDIERIFAYLRQTGLSLPSLNLGRDWRFYSSENPLSFEFCLRTSGLHRWSIEDFRDRVVEALSGTISSLLETCPCFLAGGATTSLALGVVPRDYDLFHRSSGDLAVTVEQLLSTGARHLKTTLNAHTFRKDGLEIQCIRSVFGSPEEVLSGFDFTICMSALVNGQIIAPDEFLQHLSSGQLVFNPETRNPISSLYRIQKYLRRGFKMEEESLSSLQESIPHGGQELSVLCQEVRETIGRS